MAKFDFRILLETVEGKKTSYMSQSFVDTSVDLVLSASQAYNRITGSVSCSYQNQIFFSGSDFNTSKTFKDNLLLSSSLVGGANTGSIDFNATTDEYDRLLRYKFFGEKVCNVLGLPNNQWVYVDQFRLPTDDEANIFQGNIDAGNLFISDTLTFANNANINSDIPFYIDTGSDRYIKFIDTRGQGQTSLIFGYDKDTDTYEINASTGSVFNIKNLNTLQVDTINAAQVNQVTSSTQATLATSLTGVTEISGSLVVSGSESDNPLINVFGDIRATGDVIGERYIVSSSVTHITTSFSDGSTIFGDTNTDTHKFTGSLEITGSNLKLVDNSKVIFGTGRDLQIYHSGNNSFIQDQGTGDLKILGTNLKLQDKDGGDYLTATDNAGVKIFFNESEKLETTTDGVHMVGNVSASGASTASFGRATIGTSTPKNHSTALTVNGGVGGTHIAHFERTDGVGTGQVSINANSSDPQVRFYEGSDYAAIGQDSTNSNLVFATGSIIKDKEAMVIDTNGKVGIGTTSPTVPLHINGSDNTLLLLQSSDGLSHIAFMDNTTDDSSTVRVGAAGDELQFIAGGSEVGRFDSNGKLGIGTNNPSATLHISSSNDPNLIIEDPNGSALVRFKRTDTSKVFDLSMQGSDLRFTPTDKDGTMNVLVGVNASSEKIDSRLGVGVATPREMVDVSGSIFVEGNISASGTVFAGRFESSGSSSTIDIVDNLDVTGHITASGNISASGGGTHIFGGPIRLTNPANNTATQRIEFGNDTQRIEGKDDFMVFEADNQAVIKSDVKVNIDSPIMGVGAFTTGDTAGAVLHISGTTANQKLLFTEDEVGTDIFVVSSSGNVGIGTNNPNNPLSVSGSMSVFNPNATSRLTVGEEDNSGESGNNVLVIEGDGASNKTRIFTKNTGNHFVIEANGNNSDVKLSAKRDILFGTTNATAYNHSTLMYISQSGNVGIGTTSPGEKLEVIGSISASGGLKGNDLILSNQGGVSAEIQSSTGDSFIRFTDGGSHKFSIGFDNGDSTFAISTGSGLSNNQAITIESDGKVGIGTTSPTHPLTVEGDISASGKIFANDFDFVIEGNTTTGRRFTDDDGSGVRLQRYGDTGGWAMTYGFLGAAVSKNSGTDFGGFGGHGGSSLEKFYIGGSYLKPLVSFFSGSSNDGVLIGHFDNTSSAPKTLTVQGSISSSDAMFMTNNKSIQWPYQGVSSTIRAESGHLKYTTSHGDHIFRSGSTDLVIFDASTQRVGIGTTSPGQGLHVSDAGEIVAQFDSNNSSRAVIHFQENGGEDAYVGVSTSGLEFSSQNFNSANMLLDTSGRLGIGTTSPSNLVDIHGGMLSITSSEGDHSGNSDSSGQAPSGNWQKVLRLGDDDGNNGFTTLIDDGGTSQYSLYTNRYGVKYWWHRGSTDGIQRVAQLRGHDTDQHFDLYDGTTSNVAVRLVATGSKTTYFNYGNVGFGETSPAEQIHITQGNLRIETGANGTQGIKFTEADVERARIEFDASSNNDLSIQTSDASDALQDRLTIKTSQDATAVGIGTTSPSSELHIVSGTIFADGPGAEFKIARTGYDTYMFRQSSGTGLELYNVSDTNVDLKIQNGKVGIGTSNPSAKLTIDGDVAISASGDIDIANEKRIRFAASDGTYSDDGSLRRASGEAIRFRYNSNAFIFDATDNQNWDIRNSGDSPVFRVNTNDGTTIFSGSAGQFFNLIHPTGRVGIGTTSPTRKLQVVESSANPAANFTSPSDHPIVVQSTDGTTGIKFKDNSAEQELYYRGDVNSFYIENPTKLGLGMSNPSEILDVDGNIKARDKITSTTFESGFAGSGFQIESGSDGKTTFTIDDLTVRNSMRVFELLIHQVRATNGSLFVSNTGKIVSASLSSVSNHYSMSFDTGSGYGHSFQVGDLIRAQRFVPDTNGSGSQVFKSDLHIISVNGTGSAVGVLTGSDDPRPNYEYVRIGSTSTPDRQGSIYLTADDDNAPFIDVVDGLTAHSQFNTSGKTKVRMGKLSGIGTTTFGTLPGYGFYASGSAFLEGSINATNGKIGGFTIDDVSISDTSKTLVLSSSGQITASNANITGKITANEGAIGGFTIDAHSLTTTGVEINDSTQTTFINTNAFKVDHTGNITASNVDISGTISSSVGNIGGFTIDSDEIKSGNFVLDSDDESIRLGTVVDFNKDGSNKGLFVSGSGQFFVGKEDGDFIHFDGSDVLIKSDNLNITASDIDMTTDTFALNSGDGLSIDSATQNITLGSTIILDGTGTGFVKIGGGGGGNLELNNFSSSAKGVLAQGDGDLIIKAGADKYIQFNGGDLDISTQKATISGSSVEIQSPNVFLGEGNSNFISASGGKLEISSSNFHLKNGNITASNVDLSGKITATSGQFSGDIIATHINTDSGSIGGFTLGTNKLSSTNLVLSSSTTSTDEIISASNFIVTAGGQITASNIRADGGTIGGFTIDETTISKGTNLVIDSDNPKISLNDATFGNEGIQLQYNSGNPKFHVGEGGSNATASFIKYENSKVVFGSGVTLSWGASGGNGVNLINTNDWRITSGSSFSQTSDYPENYVPIGNNIGGIRRENVIKEVIGPDSSSLVKAWGMLPDNAYGADGGWNTNWIPINNQKTYAFTEYIIFKSALTGSAYLGLYAGKDKDNDGVFDSGEQSSSLAEGLGVHNLTGTMSTPARGGVKMNTNPYFLASTINSLGSDYGIELNKWYFLVGYVHPFDSDNTTNFGGMYDTVTGRKVRNLADYMWSPSSSVALHRTYHYYNTEGTNTNGNDGTLFQQVTQPGIFEVNGSEVDISNFIDIGSAVATGNYSGSATFISEKNIFSPVIAGNEGFFNNTFRVGQASSGIHITGSGPVPNIKSGDYVSGTSGFIIDTGSAEFNNVSVRGTVVATSGQFSGDIIATHINTTSGSIGGFKIDDTSISSSNGSLRLKSNGQITASAVSMSGTIVTSDITADGGTIGGFTITGDKLSGGTDSDYVGLEPGVGIQLGDSTFADAKFSVTNAGALKSTSGTISGFSIGTEILQNTGGDNARIFIRSGSTNISANYTFLGKLPDNANLGGAGDVFPVIDGGFGIQVGKFSAQGGSDGLVFFEASSTRHEIAGFKFTQNHLAKNNITMSSANGGSINLNNSGVIISGSGLINMSSSAAGQAVIKLNSDGATKGVDLDSTQGIIGHGDITNREFETHNGQFRFTEDSISTGGGNGITYDITTQENQPLSTDFGTGADNTEQNQGGTN